MRSRRPKKSAEDTQAAADRLLSIMFEQARAQFGSAVKSFWFYDGDLCPGCMARPTGVVKIKGKTGCQLMVLYTGREEC